MRRRPARFPICQGHLGTFHPPLFGAAILLNAKSSRRRRNYDLAHELFHLLTWKAFRAENPETSTEFEEKLANKFASVFCASSIDMTHALRATVVAGRLVLDEPVELPDGTVIDLVPVDQGDDLDDEDRARLHSALARSHEDFLAGRSIPADQVMAELRAKAKR